MSNRAQHRASAALFRHEAGKGLTTFLLDAGNIKAITRLPLLARAADHWLSGQRLCSGRQKKIDAASAFLFATPMPLSSSNAASVSGLCRTCWHELPDAEIEFHAVRVLRGVLPNGKFLDPW